MYVNNIYLDDVVFYTCSILLCIGCCSAVQFVYKTVLKKDMKLKPELGMTFLVIILLIFGICLFIKTDKEYRDMFSYIGSILGGALTLVGVWLTIKHEKNERKKDRKLEYAPILYSMDNEIIIAHIDKKGLKLKEQNYENIKFSFTIKNKGRAEACNIKIIPNNDKINFTEHEKTIDILPNDESKEVEFICEYYKDIEAHLYNLSFDVIYDGIFEKDIRTNFTKRIKLQNRNTKK